MVPDLDPESTLREAFQTWDKEGSGFMKVEDLKHAMLTLGEFLPEEEVDEMIKEAHPASDGTINYEGEDYVFSKFLMKKNSFLIFIKFIFSVYDPRLHFHSQTHSCMDYASDKDRGMRNSFNDIYASIYTKIALHCTVSQGNIFAHGA